MKDKGHFYISFAKSLLRILGCALTLKTGQMNYVVILLIIAELLGIAEEIFDKR